MLSAKERGYRWRKECGVSKPAWYMFASPGVRPYRWGVSRPRVHGGYVIMVERLIITPAFDEVGVYQSVI